TANRVAERASLEPIIARTAGSSAGTNIRWGGASPALRIGYRSRRLAHEKPRPAAHLGDDSADVLRENGEHHEQEAEQRRHDDDGGSPARHHGDPIDPP